MLKLSPLKGGAGISLSISSHTSLRADNPEEVQMAENPTVQTGFLEAGDSWAYKTAKIKPCPQKIRKQAKKKSNQNFISHRRER